MERRAIAPHETVMAEPEAPPLLTAHVLPGELFVSARPTAVTTVLGSCVAVCLWDASRGQGGMNHYLMPRGEGEGLKGRRFGTVAIDELLGALKRLGSRESDLKAKIFGGGDVLAAFRTGDDSLGARNVEVAREKLHQRRILIVSEDVRGTQGRKLIFQTHDGNALIRRLGSGR